MAREHKSLRDATRKELPDLAIQRVLSIARSQHDLFERFLKLRFLYDPNAPGAMEKRGTLKDGSQVIENVIASNVDAITGSVATDGVRARFMTSGAEWSVQRRMKQLEFYAEEMDADLELDKIVREKFREGALQGTGMPKVDVNLYGEIEATAPMIDDIIVDEGALQPGGMPLELFQRHRIDRDELAAMVPEKAKEIMRAALGDGTMGSMSGLWKRWIDDGRLQRNQIGMLELWVLPIGRKGRAGYKPGVHARVIDGLCVSYEKWEERYFPFGKFVWTERPGCFYGIGGAERIAGHQRRLNKQNWQFDRQMDQIAVPTTYVRPSDANIAVQTRSALGTLAVYHGDLPHTVIPNPVSPQQYQRHQDIRSESFEEFGQSRLAATAMKPSGIDSGAALREYKDQSSDRFAGQEEDCEALKMQCIWLGLMAAKKLGKKAPVYFRKSSRGPKKLEWTKVDPREMKVSMQPASKLARTPAGRTQFVIEMAQAGVITQDESRELIQHPDMERALSLYTAARQNIERCLEEILDGEIVMPSPFMNLKMCVWLGEAQINQAEEDGAPEEILSALESFTTTAAYYLSGKIGPAAGAAVGGPPAPGQMAPGPADPAQLMPGAAPPLMLGTGAPPPMGPAPVAAFAPQAMQVMPA